MCKVSERRLMSRYTLSADTKNIEFHIGNCFVLMYNVILNYMFTKVTSVIVQKKKENLSDNEITMNQVNNQTIIRKSKVNNACSFVPDFGHP